MSDELRASFRRHLEGLNHFNRWERRNPVPYTPEEALRLVFEQYDLMRRLGSDMEPASNEAGVRRMRRLLAMMSPMQPHDAA